MRNKNEFNSLKDPERHQLFEIMDLYLDSMVKNDIKALQVRSDLKVTENGKVLSLGQGIWKTVSSINYKQYFADPLTEQVAVFCVINEGGVAATLMVRLKIIEFMIAEVEMIITREGEASVFYPKGLKEPKPIFDEIIEKWERSSKDEMIYIVN